MANVDRAGGRRTQDPNDSRTINSSSSEHDPFAATGRGQGSNTKHAVTI